VVELLDGYVELVVAVVELGDVDVLLEL